jgi:hypothetical protein
MATYEYDGIKLTINGNEMIRTGDLLAMDARGQAVVAARAGIPIKNASGVVIGVAYDLPSATVSITNRDDLAALLGEGSEMLAAYDRASRDAAERISYLATVRQYTDAQWNAVRSRRAHARRVLADLERERERLPVTADAIRARLYARPLPRRALADGRVAPQTYASEDPLPLP